MKRSTSKTIGSHSKTHSISTIQREETELKKEETANAAKVPFECPTCHWILRSAKPDDKHPIPSAAKPYENSSGNDVVTQNYVCRNPRCQEPFVVYWSNPRDFFNRI